MVTGVLSIMNLSFGNMTFLAFIALIVVVNLIRSWYYYIILLKLLNKQPEERVQLSSVNKYKFIFSKDWFENEEFEHRRIQAREALRTTIVFSIGFAIAFCVFAFHGR